MLSEFNNSLDLLNTVSEQDLYQELILQLNKDFSLVGLDYTFSKDQTPIQLKENLIVIVENLINTDFNTYLNLLYRIDISEKKIAYSNTNNMTEYFEKVSFEILKRIWKKVWFRKQFS
ncbi:hypothetical protein [Tenacibaculum xiamenense]|uniref:hypothetical protein n=1 Tax=Tenacibaculum xiamenense TaxID=1261553 RepID=UPI0038956198